MVYGLGQGYLPIPGIKRRAYREENIGAVALHLTTDDLALINSTLPKEAVTEDRFIAWQ